MTIAKLCTAAALAAALSCGAASAADAPASPTPAEQAANKDFAKLSVDGIKAFRDIQMARMAIFDGDTARAKTCVSDAQKALAKAKTEDTVFTKAESELKAAPGQKPAEATTPSTTAVAWVPVDGQMSVGEDYVDAPNKSGMAKPDAAKKTETLKLSDLDVSFTAEILPLEATIQHVDEAAELLTQNHYYEASQALRTAEDGARFDTEVVSAQPVKTKH